MPQFYLITGDEETNTKLFLNKVEKCLQNGISLIQVRMKKLTTIGYEALAKQVIALCHEYNTKILLNDNIELTQKLGADGVQLTSANLMAHNTRPLNHKYIIAASCHNKIELLHAHSINADFVTLSPILPTKSHPNATPMGWDTFKNLTKLAKIPVFALGGLKKDNLTLAVTCGAHGIAAISALWD